MDEGEEVDARNQASYQQTEHQHADSCRGGEVVREVGAREHVHAGSGEQSAVYQAHEGQKDEGEEKLRHNLVAGKDYEHDG